MQNRIARAQLGFARAEQDASTVPKAQSGQPQRGPICDSRETGVGWNHDTSSARLVADEDVRLTHRR